jgi:hypothetical protein
MCRDEAGGNIRDMIMFSSWREGVRFGDGWLSGFGWGCGCLEVCLVWWEVYKDFGRCGFFPN